MRPSQTPLAIVGMACRLPGADNLDEYWKLLVAGKTAIGPVPPERLNRHYYYDPERGQRGKTYSAIAALCHYAAFDPLSFGLSQELAARTDRSHLAALAVAVDSLRHAGYDPFELPTRRVGVYLGHTRGSELGGDLTVATLIGQAAEYLRDVDEFRSLPAAQQDVLIGRLVEAVRSRLPRRQSDGSPHVAPHQLTALISRTLSLEGPCLVLNAACASSLQALSLARRALEEGRIDMALVGGATYLRWDNLIIYSHAHSVSATGSFPFDAGADGLVAGEGYAAVVVKQLGRAETCRDHVYGIIRGIGISSDGRGKSLWAPRKEGQVHAIRRAYRGAIDARRLQYIEAHATATQLGDSIELAALAEALGPHLKHAPKIPIGSVKANIGHTLETAGAAGLIKTLLAMQHGVIPRQIGLRTLNPRIPWADVPFYVPTTDLEWAEPQDGSARRAAVNAFGIGGLNAHVVVDQYQRAATQIVRAVAIPKTVPRRRGRRAKRPTPIAVIGIGCVFPGAHSVGQLQCLLRSGRDSLSDVPPDRWDPKFAHELAPIKSFSSLVKRGGFVTGFAYDWKRHGIPPREIARGNPLQFMILQAVDAALEDASVDLTSYDRTRVGVVVGTRFGSDFADQLQVGLRLPELKEVLAGILLDANVPSERMEQMVQKFSERLLERMPALLDDSVSFSTSTLASRITKIFDLMGGAVALDAGKASSLAALAAGMDWLRDGSSDLVICAAGQRQMGLCTFEQLSLCGNFADGFLPAEGAGVLLLKRLGDARRAGDRVRAVIRHVGTSFDQDLGRGLGRAVDESLESVRLARRNICLEFVAGTGFCRQDEPCREVLNSILAQNGRPAASRLISSSTRVGHALGAAGMLSTIQALLELPQQATGGSSGMDAHRAASPLVGVSDIDEAGMAYHAILARGRDRATTRQWTAISAAAREPDSLPTDSVEGIPLLQLGGSPYEMGLAHGRALAVSIRGTLRRYADLAGRKWYQLPEVDRAAIEPDIYFGPEELAEMQGVADGAGVPLASVIAHNLFLYPDMGAGCIHLMVWPSPSATDRLIHAANEDLPLALAVRGSLARVIQVRRPCGGIPYLVFSLAGEFGGITGINQANVAITSAMLLDRPRRAATARGRLHAMIVNRILQEARQVDDALEVIRRHRPGGAWGMCISSPSAPELAYLEYDGSELRVARNQHEVMAANHTRLFRPLADTPVHSRYRLQRLEQLLGGGRVRHTDVQQVQKALRDRFDGARGRETRHPTMNTIRRVDNQISVVMQPADGQLWFTRGPQCPQQEDDYIRLPYRQLLAEPSESEIPAARSPSSQRDQRKRSRGRVALRSRAPDICRRYVLQLVPSQGAVVRRDGRGIGPAVVILGEDPLAAAFEKQIQAAGQHIERLPMVENDLDPTLRAIDQLWAQRPWPQLFLLASGHPPADPLELHSWNRSRWRHVTLPFWVCQRWYGHLAERNLLDTASLVAVTQLGGDFGLSAHVPDPHSGAVAGLVKAIKYESDAAGHVGFEAKVIDVAPDLNPEQIASGIVEELSCASSEIEVAMTQGKRCVLRPVPEPLRRHAVSSRPSPGAWVISGGARGVTAMVARQLGRRFGLKLHLLGTTSLAEMCPSWRQLSAAGRQQLRDEVTRQAVSGGQVPIEAWKRVENMIQIDGNLRSMASRGVQVTYHPCDVSDRAALSGVLARIRQADGPIRGIVHGAGYELSCRFLKKSLGAVERTIAAKCDGAAALMDLTRADPLEYFVAFGSISGRFGNSGQTDYSLANELLCKLVDWYRHNRPECHCVTVAWHSWGQVGMAVRPESLYTKKMKNMRLMPVREGVKHLLDELEAAAPESEVLITDPQYIELFYPDATTFVPSAPVRSKSAIEAARLAQQPQGPAPLGQGRPPTGYPSSCRLTRRVVRIVDAPLNGPMDAVPKPTGPAIIVGDNRDALVLRQRLAEYHFDVQHLPVYRNIEDSLRELEWIWRERPVPHLFLMTPRDRDAANVRGPAHWLDRSERGVYVPWKICQRWLELIEAASLTEQATLVCVTSLGGDFGLGLGLGLAERATAPEAGALVALVQSLRTEANARAHLGPRLKIVDAPPHLSSDTLAELIMRELSAVDDGTLVAYLEQAEN